MGRVFASLFLTGASMVVVCAPAYAQSGTYNIPSGDLPAVLDRYAEQSGVQVIYDQDDIGGLKSPGVQGSLSVETALERLLVGTGATIKRDRSGAVAVTYRAKTPRKPRRAPPPAQSSAIVTEPELSQEPTVDVVVTAQKRSQNVSDVPITMSAFSGETLKDAQIDNPTQLVKITPALNLAGSYGGQVLSFSIRGVTQQDFSAQAEGPVAVYLDDGYMALNNSAGVGLFDLDHIEVLKGPQGTLFGRNATGGLVNILTQKPKDYADGYVTASYGSYNDSKIETAMGGPLAENVDFRVAGMVQHIDNYIKNLSETGENVGGANSFAVRGHLLLKPSSNMSVLLSASHSESRLSWSPYYYIATSPIKNVDGTTINSIVVDSLRDGVGAPLTEGGSREVYLNYARSSGGRNALTGFTSKVTWDFGPELIWISDYKDQSTNFKIDSDGDSNILNVLTKSNVKNFSQELRIYNSEGVWRWYAGVYYLHVNAQVNANQVELPSSGIAVVDRNRESTNSYSAFGQIEYDLTPELTAVGGVRFTREVKDFRYASDLYVIGLDRLIGPLLGAARSPYAAKRYDNLGNAKLQLNYHPTTDLLVYAGWSRGSKAGNFTSPFAASVTFPDSALNYKPEKLDAYEVGTKASVFDRMVQLNASAFYYDYKDYQSFQFVGLSSLVINRPARTYGGEVSLIVQPTSGLVLNGGVSYTNNKVYDVPISGIVRDRIAPFTSKWQGLFNATYSWSALGGNMQVAGGGHYTGSFYYNASNFDSTLVRSYWTFDARISWRDAKDMWKLSIFGDNLTQKRYRTVGFDGTDIGGFSQVGYGRPRWLGASITRNF